MKIRLTKKQKEFHNIIKNNGTHMLAGGIASGKTFAINSYMAHELTRFKWFGWFRKKTTFMVLTRKPRIHVQTLMTHLNMFGMKFKRIGNSIFYKDKPRILVTEHGNRGFEYDELVVDGINNFNSLELNAFKKDKNILAGQPENSWFKDKCDTITSINISDNPFMSPEYIEALKELDDDNYNYWVKGDWNMKKEDKQNEQT